MTLLEMIQRIQDLERRVANMIRHAPAQEVDPAKQTVRLSLAPEGDPEMLSPPIPYAQVAGPTESGLKIHAPPMERQNMTVFAPSGDLRQAVAVPMTWSNDAPSPGQTRDPVLTYGQVRVDLTATGIKATVGTTVFEITTDKVEATIGDAKQTLTAVAFLAKFEKARFEGAKLEHNAANVGDTHRHIDSMPGPDKTGVPEAA